MTRLIRLLSMTVHGWRWLMISWRGPHTENAGHAAGWTLPATLTQTATKKTANDRSGRIATG